MLYYESNLEILKEYDKLIYEKYVKLEEKEEKIFVESIMARDGNSVLNIVVKGKKYRLNSGYYPVKEANEWVKQFSRNNHQQVVSMFGMGNGVFVEVLKKAFPEDMKLILYEPSIEIFDYAMKNMDMSKILIKNEVYLIIDGINQEKMYTVLDRTLDWNNIIFFITTLHPKYDKIFKEEYKEYCTQIRDGLIRTQINSNTESYFGKEMVYCITKTMTYLKDAQFLEQYIGKFASDIPAIIVAAGPSLDYNVEELKRAKGKAVIIATDTAMRTLNKHEIEPDFMVSIDAEKPVEYMTLEQYKKIPLICTDVTNKEIMECHCAQKILFGLMPYTDYLRPERLQKDLKHGCGSSVATFSFAVCTTLSFKTIILIGQDLAYRDGNSHAGNILEYEETSGKWLVDIEDIYGKTIKTRREWYQFLKWFDDAVQKVKNDIKVVDATEGGAKIQGTEIMSLREAIDRYCTGKIDCTEMVKNVDKAYGEDDYKILLEKVEKSVQDHRKNCEDIENLILKLKKLVDFCEKEQYGKEYKKIINDIDKIGKRIEERPVSELLEHWTAKNTINKFSSIYQMEEKVEDNEVRVYTKALEFYEKLLEASKEIGPILQNAYKNVVVKER